MIAAGLFRGEHIELIRGVIVEMSPQNARHADVIQALTRLLLPPLLRRADIRVQLPFAAGSHSLPEPDLALVKPGRYQAGHPDEAFLLIEVSDASLKLDRQDKAELYATAGVPEYWIVNLVDRAIEQHSEPSNGAYTRVIPFRSGETIRPLAFGDLSLNIDEIFGG